jgi:DNA mismatch repair ATPase MutS
VILEDFYHPSLTKPVVNSLSITPESNIIFLTGANMAGKSTFMKALGITMYLAQMGFPVPASKMEFSVRDGIYTTINLPDNLSIGASHFYAEVLRIKTIARELSRDKYLFVIFDELFRGTNVKDAYEATIAITSAIARRQNCMFIVSTHIIEAGDVLKEKCDNINFVYLPTLMDGNKPVYTHKLAAGITSDRHGMVIIMKASWIS